MDIDDPDIEAQSVWLPRAERLEAMRGAYYWILRYYSHAIRRYPKMVSNPVLAQLYGGEIIPHVRHDPGPPVATVAGPPSVAFIGTPKIHKGIDVLRAAVERLSGQGYTLDVTAPPPADAKPWERWHGFTSIEDGLALTAGAGVIAIPSLPGGYARAQFPVKIVDALFAARPVVASDVGPVGWAVGEGGRLVPPGDVEALAAALASLRAPELREAVGAAGRAHALHDFTVDAVRPRFEAVLESVAR